MEVPPTIIHLRDRRDHEMSVYAASVVPRVGEVVSAQYWDPVVLSVEHHHHHSGGVAECHAHVFLDIDWERQMNSDENTANDWTEGRRCRIISKLT